MTCAPAHAAVEGSPHDLVSQGYDVPKRGGSQERCTVCHAASRASTQGFSSDVPPSLRGTYGAASLLCFSCHDGITLAAAEVDASLTAFHPGSHGLDLAAYRGLSEQEGALPSLVGDHMECTTCHDPHDNTRRPFLRGQIGELCQLCHSPLVETPVEGLVNSSGNHPLGRDAAATPREDMPIRLAADFTVPFPAPYPPLQGKGSVGTHWDLGGHLLQGATGELSCVTCHAVHGDENAAPAPTLLAKDPVRDIADELCEGCHRGQRGDGGVSGAAPNPGGTLLGRTYHPCDDDVANGEGRILETLAPTDWPLGGGSPERLLCSTCHRAHGAAVGTRLLRPAVRTASFCGECHDEARLDYHHPTGLTEGQCTNQLSSPGAGGAIVGCESCHRAHNAGRGARQEGDFVPILRSSLRSDELCLRCHPAGNPTCRPDVAHTASHFLGDPRLPDTYDDPDPPLRTDPWPESGLFSLYGGEEDQVLICLSCHSFRPGTVVSGDDGTRRHLLARSGNPVQWEDSAMYLCTGCHSDNPGTGTGDKGHTHPLMSASMERIGREPDPPASKTPEGRVNCDSCHRPHEAVTRGGVYILEKVDGVNEEPREIKPVIDFTPLCHCCHAAGKY